MHETPDEPISELDEAPSRKSDEFGELTRAAAPAAPPAPLFGPWTTRFLLLALFAVGLGVRAWNAGDPPLEFHPFRQYRSALMARSYATQARADSTETQRALATAYLERNRPLEPPILERVTARIWNERGEEELWIPRALSIAAWMLGGLALFALARRLANRDGALFTAAVFWFLPFTVPASRSFQPDPTMVALVAFSLLFQWCFHERQSWWRFLLAVLFAAAAMYVKPVAAFALFASWMALRWHQKGLRGLFGDGWTWLFGLLSLAPTAAYYIDGIFLSGFLADQAQESFNPGLILDARYWQGWLRMLDDVTGRVLLFVALFALTLMRTSRARVFGVALWLGYLAFGLVFSHHIHTHNYYSLPLIPVIALSVAPLGAAVLRACAASDAGTARRGVVILLLAGALGWTIHESRWRKQQRDTEWELEIFEAIGESVAGETETVILGMDQARPLQFHGNFSGFSWPYSPKLEALRRAGAPPLDVSEKLAELDNPKLFVVADPRQLRLQPELSAYLEPRPIVAEGRLFKIYDLHAEPTASPVETAPDPEPPASDPPLEETPGEPVRDNE